MLSKEEIEKAKERIQKSLNDIWFGTLYSQEENDEDEKILLQYIDQLEQYLEKISKQLDNVAIDQIPIGIAELQQENKRLTHTNKSYKGIINKLNKIIDEMAKEINKAYFDEEDFWLWFEKDIINKTSNLPERIIKIKQYFEKKVEEK